jgi:hypothetical protein
MIERIKQVGTTYLTHRHLWLFAGSMVVMIVPQLFLAAISTRSPAKSDHAIMFVLGMPVMFLLPFLVGQAKSQFAHARSRLMPQFLPAHLTVLCGILLTLFVVYPLTLALLSRFEPLGLFGLALAMGVPTLWASQLNRFSFLLIAMVVFFSLMTDPGRNWWMIDASAHRGIHAVIAVAGIVLVIAWLWRLCHLREECDDYQNLNPAMVARRSGSEGIEQRRIVAMQAGRNRLGAWVGDWWHDRLGGYRGGSSAGLARVLRYGLGAQPIEFQGLIFSAIVLSVGIVMNQYGFESKSGGNSGSYFFFVQFAIILPGYMAGELMAMRRPRVASEMLLPLSRTQLIDALLANLARNSVVLWLMMNVSLGVVVAVVTEKVSLGQIGMFLLLSASTMFACMAASLRASVWTSRAKRILVLGLSCGLLLPPIITWTSPHENVGEWPFLLLAIGFLAGSAWLFYSARRAWLDLEFT